eukprot:Selendium_serpulae@DN4345_c0_g1_i1.p1
MVADPCAKRSIYAQSYLTVFVSAAMGGDNSWRWRTCFRNDGSTSGDIALVKAASLDDIASVREQIEYSNHLDLCCDSITILKEALKLKTLTPMVIRIRRFLLTDSAGSEKNEELLSEEEKLFHKLVDGKLTNEFVYGEEDESIGETVKQIGIFEVLSLSKPFIDSGSGLLCDELVLKLSVGERRESKDSVEREKLLKIIAESYSESHQNENVKRATEVKVQCWPDVERRNEEFQYLDLVAKILNEGIYREDRTGVGSYSVVGGQFRFDLAKSFPLLTTKRVFWRGVVEELLWFIRGDTNGHHLLEKNVKIWEGNGTKAFLESRGITDREEHDLGPIYGFQWRHFGAAYPLPSSSGNDQQDGNLENENQENKTKKTEKQKKRRNSYTGVDQLKEVIRQIKEDPESRRIIMSAWNPCDLSEMALPPCHVLCQFFVLNGKLSSILYQRSCDIGLGVPFNTASYSLLTLMLARVCGLQPGEFVHILGDAHIYKSHIEPLKQQIRRLPRSFPTLKILDSDPQIAKDSLANDPHCIPGMSDLTMNSFVLDGYFPHPKIQMELAV